MVNTVASNWTVRGTTLLLWAAAAASVAYWGLKLSAPSSSGPVAAPVARQPSAADPAAVARLLGSGPAAASAAAPAPSLASRFNLLGVVADASQAGAALIAVDGKPAKPFRVGARVDEGLVLQSVQPRRAVLAASADGPAVLTLELPALK